jgi:hypothetical protein
MVVNDSLPSEQSASAGGAAARATTEPTEQQMRDAEAPHPRTTDELFTYIDNLTGRKHDYGTCVYAMSLAAVAAFNYVAHKLGVTGFQASCADLDILRRTRGMKGPFMLLKAQDMLYPQYDLPRQLFEAMEEWKPWVAEQAAKQLAEYGDDSRVYPDVLAHWKRLASEQTK